jgi:hypothetical protein
MIDDLRAFTDRTFPELFDEGRRLSRAGRHEEARRSLVAALFDGGATERDQARAAGELGLVLRAMGDARGALACAWFSGGWDEPLLDGVPPADLARTLERRAAADPAAARALRLEAARALEAGGRLARAAFLYEAAGEATTARAAFERLAARAAALPGEPYVEGLARLNVARVAEAPEERARSAAVAVERFEEAAERFLSAGRRERAFDCYELIALSGRIADTFVHEQEGHLNAIRMLVEDRLVDAAIEYWEGAIDAAARRGEHRAAATIARDLAAYGARERREEVALRAKRLEASLWEKAAGDAVERGAPREMARSALLASALARSEIGDDGALPSLYERLAALEEDPERRSYYASAASRGRTADGLSVTGRADPEALVTKAAPDAASDVLRDDLVEWEDAGDAADACADVLVDDRLERGAPVRRAALLGFLAAVALDRAAAGDRERASVTLAERLGAVGLYRTLAPLERLARDPSPVVRVAAVRAAGRHPYKRSFATLERALSDAAPDVVLAAKRALERIERTLRAAQESRVVPEGSK